MDLKMNVYTPGLELIGLLEVQNSAIWETKAFGAGSFSVSSILTKETRPLLSAENIIWIAGDDAGVIEYISQEAEESTSITVKGCNLTGLLARRILWGRYDLSGTPPQIMHYLVNECAVNPTRGDTVARKIPGLVLLDPPTGGTSIRVQRTGGELLETLEELGATYGVAFGIRFNPAVPQMEFWTRWGVNRSIRQTVNDPVFYSTELDDVLTSQYTYNSGDYRNVALIAGEGEGNDRVMVTVEGEDETYIPDVPTPEPTPDKYTVTLSVDPSGGGVATGGGTVNGGTYITVTAAPAQKYGFVGWRENGAIVSTEPAYTFAVNRNRNLTAVFVSTVVMYTVTVLADPAGGGSVSGGGSVEEGQSVTLTQTTADGYNFTGWYNGSTLLSTSNPYTFTPTANITVTAKFAAIPVYTITVAVDPAGAGTVTGAGQYQEGTQATITATPAEGYTFSGWQENGATVSTDNPYTFTANGDRSFVAVLADRSLPEGYQKIEYFKTGSNCRIDVGLYAFDFTKLQIDIKPDSTGGVSTAQYVANIPNNYGIWRYPENTVRYNLGSMPSYSIQYTIQANRQIIEFDRTAKKLSIDGNSFDVTMSSNQSQATLCFCAGLDTYYNILHNSIPSSFYGSKVFNDDELIADFIPCTDASGNVGLYDVVRKRFYGNGDNGALAPGPAV